MPLPDRPHAHVRASDDDRERVATALRDSYSEGRLTMDEFQDRLERAYAARTHGELTILTADLPVRVTYPPPPVPAMEVSREVYWRRFREIAIRYAVWCIFLISIWVVTGAHASFWPIWPIIVFGFIAATRILGIEQRERRRMVRAARRQQRQEERMRRRGGPLV
jgi:hypothetical protein